MIYIYIYLLFIVYLNEYSIIYYSFIDTHITCWNKRSTWKLNTRCSTRMNKFSKRL